MKYTAILILVLLCYINCEFEQKCHGDPACEECAIGWSCDYGNNEAHKEECYKQCLEHKINYDQHAEVENAKETTVHLAQIKQEGPEAKKCKENAMCESCAGTYFCDYGASPAEIEKCYSDCYANKDNYTAGQKDTMNAQETFAQIKQEGPEAKKCKENAMCESCAGTYFCDYGASPAEIEKCYSDCYANKDNYTAGQKDTMNAQETFAQIKQEGPEAKKCKENAMCESCAGTYFCDYGASPAEIEKCYSDCYANKDNYTAGQKDTMNAQETFAQIKQEGPEAKKCKENAMCESCAGTYFCDYGASPAEIEKCYSDCYANKDNYTAGQKDTMNAQETFAQIKQEGPEAKKCKENAMCESCAGTYFCDYGASPAEIEKCYSDCYANKDNYTAGQKDTMNAQETFAQIKQEGPEAKKCKENAMCESCAGTYFCDYGASPAEIEKCYSDCYANKDNYTAGQKDTMNAQETFAQIKQEGPEAKKCKENAMCESCAGTYFCDYGASPAEIEKCYSDCYANKDNYTAGQKDTMNAQETFAQIKQEGPEAKKCKENAMCESCAGTYFCDYGASPAEIEKCYSDCYANKDNYTAGQKDTMNAQETFAQIKQEGPEAKKCKENAMCESCAGTYFCDYGASPAEIEKCYSDCYANKDNYTAGQKDTMNAQETLVQTKSFLSNKQESTQNKDLCKRNQACEACAISWQCEYGNSAETIKDCYKLCYEHKIDYDLHREVLEGQETTV